MNALLIDVAGMYSVRLATFWNPMRRLQLFALLCFALAASAQQTRPSSPVITSTTRLVLVDVIAADQQGKPVSDLQASEFALLEDGKLQRVASFSRESAHGVPRQSPSPLPKDVFTNDPQYTEPAGPLTLVLIDLMNTPVPDRRTARRATLEFVTKQLRPGQPVAVFGLANQLVLLQDFSTDPRLLMAAVERFHGDPRTLSIDHSNSRTLQTMIDYGLEGKDQALAAIKRFEAADEIAEITDRVGTTLRALRSIARAAQRYPGRKSLVWISGAFPLTMPDRSFDSVIGPEAHLVSYADEVKYTAVALSDAQIAVYPVDVRGLIDVAPDGDTAQPMAKASRARNPGEHWAQVAAERAAIENPQHAMKELAEDTGGRAFINRNDLPQAIAAAVEDGTTYYTLAYYPSDKRWNGNFRKIKISITRPGVHLRYRAGYYAQDSGDWKRNGGEREIDFALEHDVLPTSKLVFGAHVIPPAAGAPVNIEFLVFPSSLSFESQGNMQNASVDAHALALGADDKRAGAVARTADIRLEAATYSRALKSGLRLPVTMQLPPGQYRLRLALRDNRSGIFGTLEVPVTVPKEAKATPLRVPSQGPIPNPSTPHFFRVPSSSSTERFIFIPSLIQPSSGGSDKMARPRTPKNSSSKPRVVKRAEVAEIRQAEPQEIRSLSPDVQDRIRRRAYELWEQGGRRHGRAEQDWLRAEREILGQHGASRTA